MLGAGTLDEGQLKISLQDLLNADKQGSATYLLLHKIIKDEFRHQDTRF